MPTWTLTHCAQCGAPIQQRATGRPRRYCSSACRTAAYRVTKAARTPPSALSHIIRQADPATPRSAGQGQPGKANRS